MVAEMGGDPHTPGRISVTIKGDGKDATWLVLHGSPKEVHRQIIEVFDLSGESDQQSLSDLIVEATALFKGQSNVRSTLGGRTIPKGDGGKPAASGSAWEQAANEEPVDINVVRLTKAIEETTDVDSLKVLYARNKAHFDGNAELFAEWQAKGKSLSS